MRKNVPQKNLLSSTLSLERLSSAESQSLVSNILSSGWDLDEPSTFSISEDFYYLGTAFTLKVVNPTEDDIVIKGVESAVSFPYISEKLIFHALLFCETDLTVSVYLHPSNDAYTTVTPFTQQIIAGRWMPAFSNEYTFGDDEVPFASVEITIVIQTDSPAEAVFFTLPTLTLNEPHEYNQFYKLSTTMFPDIFKEVDMESDAPKYPFAKIFHSMTADASRAMDKYVQMSSFETFEIGHASSSVDGTPYNTLTKSELTSPDLMQPEYLEWGAMLRGGPTISDVKVNNVSVFDPSFDFRRWQVESAAFGHAAGSRQSIKSAVSNVLSGSRVSLVTPLWQGQQFQIMIRTLTSETPGNLSQGATSPSVLAVAEPTRPAGFVFLHQTVNEINFILNDPDFGVFNQSDLD